MGTEINEAGAKNVALCLTGSVAIIETPNLAIKLRKEYGVNVQCFMTENAIRNGLSPEIMEWATKNHVVKKLTGSTEHMKDFDLVIVYPATFNTVNKIANGIADNAVTAICGATLGNKLIIVPAMNVKFYNNPIFKENLLKLERLGVLILRTRIQKGKDNISPIEEIISNSMQILSGNNH